MSLVQTQGRKEEVFGYGACSGNLRKRKGSVWAKFSTLPHKCVDMISFLGLQLTTSRIVRR